MSEDKEFDAKVATLQAGDNPGGVNPLARTEPDVPEVVLDSDTAYVQPVVNPLIVAIAEQSDHAHVGILHETERRPTVDFTARRPTNAYQPDMQHNVQKVVLGIDHPCNLPTAPHVENVIHVLPVERKVEVDTRGHRVVLEYLAGTMVL